MNLIKKHWILLSLLFWIFVSIISLVPLPELPELPGNDKTGHLVAYAVLALPVSIALPKKWYWILLFFLFWSGVIELIQPYVNRHGEWLDFAANGVGISLGLMVGRIANRLFSRPSMN